MKKICKRRETPRERVIRRSGLGFGFIDYAELARGVDQIDAIDGLMAALEHKVEVRNLPHNIRKVTEQGQAEVAFVFFVLFVFLFIIALGAFVNVMTEWASGINFPDALRMFLSL